MTDLVVTAKNVKVLFGLDNRVRSHIAQEAILAGQSLYKLTTGKVGLAGAAAAGKQETIGIALNSVAAGEAVAVVEFGAVGGFAVSGLSVDVQIYQSDTLGALADAAGTKSVVVGRIKSLTDAPTYTKYLEFYAPPATKR